MRHLNEITQELFDSTSDNVVMVGYGRKTVGGVLTDDIGLVFGVLEKKPLSEIPENELIPKKLTIDDTEFITDVVEFEIPTMVVDCPNDFYTWQTVPPPNRGIFRPVKGGISLTNVTSMSNSVGTFGFVAVDNDTNSVCGVTNAHVIIDDAFYNNQKTLPTPITNVVNDVVIQPGWEAGFYGSQNSVGIVKKYVPLSTTSTNKVDTALFTLGSGDISSTESYKQVGMTGWTSPMDFASVSDLNSIVPYNKYLYSSGRSTGAKGEGDMKLIASLTNTTQLVFGYPKQGVGQLLTFNGITQFVASATTTPVGNICPYPIYPGDSGSAVAAEFGGQRKIVGQAFAASTYQGYYIPINEIVNELNISPYTGQTTCFSDTGNTQIHLVSGRSADKYVTIDGNQYWLGGLVDCPSVSSTPTPTPTYTPTHTPTPTPTSPCNRLINSSFEIFMSDLGPCPTECTGSAWGGGSTVDGTNCTAPTTFNFYPEECIPGWETTDAGGKIEIWESGYRGVPAYHGNYFAEINAQSSAPQSLYQTFTAVQGQQYQVQFAHRGRVGFLNTLKVGLSGDTTGLVFFPSEYTGLTNTWILNTINFTATESDYNLVFSATSSQDGGNFLDSIDVVCQPSVITQTPTPTNTTTPTLTPSSTGLPEDCCRTHTISVIPIGECTGFTLNYLDCGFNQQTLVLSRTSTGIVICAIPNSFTFSPNDFDCNLQIVAGEDCNCVFPVSETPTPTPTSTPTVTPTVTPTFTPSSTPDFTPTQTQTNTPTPSATPPCCSTYNLYSMQSETYTITNCDGTVTILNTNPYYAFTVCALNVTPLNGYIYPECECCETVENTVLTSNVFDGPSPVSYSKGWAVVGIWNGSVITTNTGSIAKSSLSTTVSVAGDLGYFDSCERGAIEVTAMVPQGGAGAAGYRTEITVKKNGFVLGVVTSGVNPSGSNVTQTFDFSRQNGDVLSVDFNSFQ